MPIFNIGGANPASRMPLYTYTGTKNDINDGNEGGIQNWQIDFLTSGTFTPQLNMEVDIFCVGAGGGGGAGSSTNGSGKGGGAGGFTKTVKKVSLVGGTAYTVTVGAGVVKAEGGASSVKQGSTVLCTANGGKASSSLNGASGGSGGGAVGLVNDDARGGQGASNGANAANTSVASGGQGQGTTTRKFEDSNGTLYAGGGGGSFYGADASLYGKGVDGGGNGGVGDYHAQYKAPTAGTANTGGGGGGEPTNGSGAGTKGGSGLVSIRNAR